MSHVVTDQPVANPAAYSTVIDTQPVGFDNVVPVEQLNPDEELKRQDAHKEQSAVVNDCCCYIDDDADFFCIAFVRCIADMFHGMGVCLDGCCEGCANCINSCCNDECACSGCDCSGCDCSGCDCSD